MSYTIPLLIVSMVALSIGVRLFKIEQATETHIAGRDILSIALIILSIFGAYSTAVQFQYDTLALGSAGPSVCPTTDLANVLTTCPSKTSGALANNGTQYCTPSNGACLNCRSQPSANPNACHIYTWNVPTDIGVTPIQGLFDNDTSYYFTFNITNVVGFQICIHLLPPVITIPNNQTLVLQYYNGTISPGGWNDVDDSTSGSLFVPSFQSAPFEAGGCSSTTGAMSFKHGGCAGWATDGGGPGCSFRIAGNEGATPFSTVPTTLTFTQLWVQFQTQTAFNNVISCAVPTTSSTQFTFTCSRPFTNPSGAQLISVQWKADNVTGSGCPVNHNCYRGPAVGSCSIAALGTSCSQTFSFSPAFTNTPYVYLDKYSPVTSGTVKLGAPFVVPIAI